MDHGVILEYQLPLSSQRLDFLICGKNSSWKDNATIVELKQWERCEDAEGPNEVLTRLGGGEREVLHPSVQVDRYRVYLQDGNTAFHESNPIALHSCAYLHNYNSYSKDALLASKFDNVRQHSPMFTADDVPRLQDFLVTHLDKGRGSEVLQRIEQSKYRPSRMLMDHVATIIDSNSEYTLLDEQLVVYDKIFSLARQGFHDKQKTAVIVKGGPGTGKSLIAVNLLADLSRAHYNTKYATGSRAFTETLKKKVGPRAAQQCAYFSSFGEAEPNAIDVLISDESHRIREKTVDRFRPHRQTGLPQIDELINAAKVAVFFIDDLQVVRPGEIGSVSYIKEQTERKGCKIKEYQLDVQFRCAGSDAFVSWVENTLGLRRTANVIWEGSEGFEFSICASPEDLEGKIREKAAQGFKSRLTAGYCWHWSDPKPDGTLVDDVVIDGYKRPWNARPDRGKLARGIPKSHLWSDGQNGINQIGCVYTAQGFDFDYVGVIFGPDLTYRFEAQEWEGHPSSSHDPLVRSAGADFVRLTKNTYRVLFSRAMKGCYVYFVDKDTERFVRSRMEQRQK